MDLTTETVLRMAREMVGVDLSLEEAQAILPYLRSYLDTAAELEALGLGVDDPREMSFAEDARYAP